MRLRGLGPRVKRAAIRGIARGAVRVGSFGARPRSVGKRSARQAERRPGTFDVYTFVTDEEQYRALKASFAAAGFRPPSARFVPLWDRRTVGGSDPYELISRIGAEPDRPYVILTHQDVRLDQGVGIRDLVAVLERLDVLDPRWVVAGNAGGAPDLHLIRRLHDPYGGSTSDELPARVVSLDENFLVFNPRQRPRCSPGLEGFHFYGTDACLNALREGGTSYVIDFPVTHLSGGDKGSAYDEAKERFVAAWQPRLIFGLLRASTEIVFVSRWGVLRRLFGSPSMLRRIEEVVPPLRLDTDGAA